MTTTVEADPGGLVAVLRVPVWNTLTARAESLRRALPPRPDAPAARYAWLCSLTPAQARDAAHLDHLDALCAHLAGHPALGYAPDDPLPEAALEAAEGFNSQLTALITRYRAARDDGRTGQR
ncbi:hypothetical protein ABT390_34880 [Streptomyces aurantiacus]|uniref:Uncharacterized protein n=1 Tax=Streptomyces aurantiacus JA 4570 TaxID=1286094 RepID=S3ZRW4_9ACTN|nr:hypothetical protein [Streptomyces aurantiacus]EPH41150.1 hypothetical protein STRAU_5802 [Streptomyces aurantiacus JA 4570]